jgi:hypothetical protein
MQSDMAEDLRCIFDSAKIILLSELRANDFAIVDRFSESQHAATALYTTIPNREFDESV